MNEILEEMPEDTAEYFCERVLKRDWPNCIHVYSFIKNAFKWRGKNSAASYKLFVILDDIENGTFVGILSRREKEYPDVITTYTCPGNEEQFRRILSNTEFINWHKKPLFQVIPLRMKSIVESIIESKGLRPSLYFDAILHWMPANKAAQLDYEVPTGVFIRKLNAHDIDLIYSLWSGSDVYPKSDLIDSVRLNIGLGVFSGDNDEPLAWAMCGSYRGLGILFVQPKCRGRGLGKLVVLAVTKAMGENGVYPHVIIEEENNASMGLFKNVGYATVPTPVSMVWAKDSCSSDSVSSFESLDK